MSPAKERILIVDDDVAFRVGTVALLEDAGLSTSAVENGELAKSLLAERQFDLVRRVPDVARAALMPFSVFDLLWNQHTRLMLGVHAGRSPSVRAAGGAKASAIATGVPCASRRRGLVLR